MMPESCKRQCVRPEQPSSLAPQVVSVNGPVATEMTAGPIANWPLEMPVYMMSGSVSCTISLDSIEMRVPEIKLMIELKTGIPQAEQDLFLDGCPALMQNQCRLCHYADALYKNTRRMVLVRRSPVPKQIDGSTLRRLKKEFQNIQRSELLEGCSLAPLDLEASPLSWTASISGAPDGPYAGGIFHLDIMLPADYPYKAPVIRFTTPVFHPLVASSGSIDLALLHENWVPVMTLEKIILRIKQDLEAPYGPPGWSASFWTGCGNHEATLLSNDKEAFDRRARQETILHATLPLEVVNV